MRILLLRIRLLYSNHRSFGAEIAGNRPPAWTASIKDPFRRRYLRGCLKAYLRSAMERRFYDLGRINFWGQKGEIDWGFDESKVHARADRGIRAGRSGDVGFGIPNTTSANPIDHAELFSKPAVCSDRGCLAAVRRLRRRGRRTRG